MIGLMLRILRVADQYKGRIRLAAFFSFLKSVCSKGPIFCGFLYCSRFHKSNNKYKHVCNCWTYLNRLHCFTVAISEFGRSLTISDRI